MDINNRDYRSNKISVLLINRNKFFRQGARAALERHPDIRIVGESDVNEDAFDLIRALMPKIVLIGVNPPLVSGMDLARKIAQELSGTMTAVMTPYPNDDELVTATMSGSAAYLSNDIDADDLADSIRRIADGELLIVESFISKPHVLERILRRFQALSLKGRSTDSVSAPITERETEILSYVACGYGNKQIALALKISEQTIKNHMTSILSKLDANDRTHAVVMAMQSGWISTSTERSDQETLQS